MRNGKVGLVVWLILSLVLKFCSASPTSSSLINRVGSSLLFPVHGNVYPTGYYNVTLYMGQPAKPYFLDIDTGSDLTWLQCDAPCVHCTEAPHPYYKPNNDLVVCKDPICASLHAPGDHKCPDPGQCDYEVQYADSGSSLGVLVRDAFAFNYITGVRINPRLALGCGYDQLPGPFNHPLDGILGLGKGRSSILAQLHSQNLVRNVIGHCLSGRGKKKKTLTKTRNTSVAKQMQKQRQQRRPRPSECEPVLVTIEAVHDLTLASLKSELKQKSMPSTKRMQERRPKTLVNSTNRATKEPLWTEKAANIRAKRNSC
ncbi:aspartic proteinase Asp1-like [Pistacia vera]|uniref:aspartic proteinase Asp1-like n=1 Tax=Pistacia vera TaxID=55513 RepID=UPI001262C7A8|nr:aspartic proteinase Asp1-like [Pistacia vera]